MSTQNLLEQKTIIVTGGATGIGQAFALSCAAQGANLVVADMNSSQETVDAIKKAGGQAIGVEVDVSNQESLSAMADAALKAYGRIDGLVNNAAYFREVKLTPLRKSIQMYGSVFFRSMCAGFGNAVKR